MPQRGASLLLAPFVQRLPALHKCHKCRKPPNAAIAAWRSFRTATAWLSNQLAQTCTRPALSENCINIVPMISIIAMFSCSMVVMT
jgi:hypothetical protein